MADAGFEVHTQRGAVSIMRLGDCLSLAVGAAATTRFQSPPRSEWPRLVGRAAGMLALSSMPHRSNAEGPVRATVIATRDVTHYNPLRHGL